MEHISGPVIKEMERIRKACPHLTPAGECGAMRLSTGEPWITCQAAKEINMGCKVKLDKIMEERKDEK